MIDFQNASFVKLRPVKADMFAEQLQPLLLPGEVVMSAFQGIRDGVVFTSKRMIAINVQGVTGKKRDYTSLPYSKIQTFSVETAGLLDLDSELVLWFSSLGKVTFEFTAQADVAGICRTIGAVLL